MKRRIALITAIFMLMFSLPVFGANFKDMPTEDSKYHDAFVYAINKKLVSGDGVNLNPDSYITQAEALTIISRIKPFDCEETDITGFGVSKDKWYYSTVAKAYTLGYVTADTLSPERPINRISANNIIGKVYGKTPTPWPSNESCTRADFIWEIYFQAPDGKYSVTQVPTETASETPTEPVTEFTDLKAKAAQEAMQVALGVLPDGTIYSKVAAYRDESQEDWGGGSGSGGSSSSRPSRPTEPKEEEDEESDDEYEEPSTEDAGSEITPTEPVTEPPTEQETPEPTYGEYDGPIDNDKDNVIEDPFDDGWRPPGWVGDDGDDDESQGGYDEEDDFEINDADDPDYVEPTDEESTAPSEEETSEPTDEGSTAPSEDETSEPTDEGSTAPSEDETSEPTDEESSPSENETNETTDEGSTAPSEDETSETTDEDSTSPSEDETSEPTDEESSPSEDETSEPSDDATLPPESEEETSDSENSENADDETTGDGENEPEATAVLLSKDWWFD